jgi:hypothetical protein
MKRKFIFSLAFFLCGYFVSSQNNVQYSYQQLCYYKNDTCYNITEIHIKNTDNSPYVLWISDSNKTEKSDEILIKEFFLLKHGDFSFMNIIYEDIYNKIPIEIGKNFITTIEAGKEFRFILLTKDKMNETDIYKFYKEHVVLMPKEKLNRFLFPEKIYYPFDYIILCN